MATTGGLGIPARPPSAFKHIKHNVSFAFNRVFHTSFNRISNTQLIVGQLPSEEMLSSIRSSGHLVAIVSVCESFELTPFIKPVLSARAAGVEHLIIEQEDFGTVTPAKLEVGAAFIQRVLQKAMYNPKPSYASTLEPIIHDDHDHRNYHIPSRMRRA